VEESDGGMLAARIQQQSGIAEVRDVFKSPKIGAIAGLYGYRGVIKRANQSE